MTDGERRIFASILPEEHYETLALHDAERSTRCNVLWQKNAEAHVQCLNFMSRSVEHYSYRIMNGHFKSVFDRNPQSQRARKPATDAFKEWQLFDSRRI